MLLRNNDIKDQEKKKNETLVCPNLKGLQVKIRNKIVKTSTQLQLQFGLKQNNFKNTTNQPQKLNSSLQEPKMSTYGPERYIKYVHQQQLEPQQ